MDDNFEDYFEAPVQPETLSAGTAFPPLTLGIASLTCAIVLLAGMFVFGDTNYSLSDL
jgi:hypothetical protein